MTDIDQIRINFNPAELHTLNIALAIIMFGIALDVSLNDFKILFKQPKIVSVGILSQFILLPILTFLMVIILKPHPSIALGMILIGSVPGGNVSNFFSKLAKANVALSVSLTAFATFLAVLMTPLNFEFWGSLYKPTRNLLREVSLDFWDMARVVTLLMGIPLLLGMLIRNYFPKTAHTFSKILKPLSLISFLILIIMAFHQNWDLFINHIHLVFWLVVAHNLLAYFLGYYTAKSFKLKHQDAKTVAIETGIQNSGLGLLLIFGIFHGMGGMALFAAFWGVWDIVSGLALAWYWGRKDQ